MNKKEDLFIRINDILKLEEMEKYKIHAARINTEGWHPLDAYVENEEDWHDWNRYYPGKNEFNREYILSIMEFYPKPNTWLFGGIFKVLGLKKNYIIEEVECYKKYSGRLLFNFVHKIRATRLRLENYIDSITVNQIFEFKYTGIEFPGYEKINHPFYELERIFKLNKSDWKTALENVKGVYLLTDTITGKSYIGSAYGDFGIWSRWSNYINTFHGWNDQMFDLVNKKGEKYIRDNFKFSILEIYGLNKSDEEIIGRESYWKEKLMTREFGYNSN